MIGKINGIEKSEDVAGSEGPPQINYKIKDLDLWC